MDEAIECYKNAMTIAKEIGDRQGEAATAGNLAGLFFSQERLEEGLVIAAESIDSGAARAKLDALAQATSRAGDAEGAVTA